MINRTVGAVNCSLVVPLLIIQSIVFTEIHHFVLSHTRRDSENLVWPPLMRSRLQRPEATLVLPFLGEIFRALMACCLLTRTAALQIKLSGPSSSVLSRMIALYPRLAMPKWRVEPTKHLTTSYVSPRDRDRSSKIILMKEIHPSIAALSAPPINISAKV